MAVRFNAEQIALIGTPSAPAWYGDVLSMNRSGVPDLRAVVETAPTVIWLSPFAARSVRVETLHHGARVVPADPPTRSFN